MDSSTNQILNENILEIRYKPNPQILDYRGDLTKNLSAQMDLDQWKIDINRVDLFRIDQSIRVFVSFRNAGVVMRNIASVDSFVYIAQKYIHSLFNQKVMNNSYFIERVGVRSRFAFLSELSFEKMVEKYQENFIVISDNVSELINAKLIDIGFPLNYETEKGNINLIVGPMKKDQLHSYFSFEKKEVLPDVVFYYDFDYWKTINSQTSVKDLSSLLKTFAEENWQKCDDLHLLINRE